MFCSALCPNADLRHGLIGAGVYASHGYERSYRDGAENTLKVLAKVTKGQPYCHIERM